MKQLKMKYFLMGLLVWSVITTISVAAAEEVSKDLVQAVAKLKIGYQGYVIGQALSRQQVEAAQQDLEKKAYPGTYKFKVGEDAHVVVAKEGNIVLAVYREADASTAEDLREILSDLIDNFGEPTAMAHDKNIYWVYGAKGKISEEAFKEAKNGGVLDAMITVKMCSSEGFQAVKDGEKESADVYFIVSSQPLLQGIFTEAEDKQLSHK